MFLVAGLGNPGETYANTRHNVGFLALDAFVAGADSMAFSFSGAFEKWKFDKHFNAEICRAGEILLAKPQTFMNLSGNSIAVIAKFFKIPNEKILVIHDDVDLGFGALRIKIGGGHGGHNGLKSIDAAIGADYARLRVGVGKDAKIDTADFVLSRFKEAERSALDTLFQATNSAILDFTNSVPLANLQNKYTQKPLNVS